jgi:hypothetical protein
MKRAKRNFKTRFNEHRKDLANSTGKSTFSEHILNAGHEMRPRQFYILKMSPRESTLLKKRRL